MMKSIADLVRALLVAANRKLLSLARPANSAALMAIVDVGRTKQDLIAENAMLRRQLIIATRNPKGRWRITARDRAALFVAAAFARHWRKALLLVKPDTLLRCIGKVSSCSGSVRRGAGGSPSVDCRRARSS
ncbi:MAG: hypothetical protein OXR73_35170 [Myxococcales bacterium]|nr:hypothetical protein [Myxococcales bacterium]